MRGNRARLCADDSKYVKNWLGFSCDFVMFSAMSDKDERAKRLAEELRKNLRRRKGQDSDRKKVKSGERDVD